MKSFFSLLFIPLIGIFLASCSGGGSGAHFPLKVLVTPEDAVGILGGEVGPVMHDSLGDFIDRGSHSYTSNCRYESKGAGKGSRTLQVQGFSWEVDAATAQVQYESQVEKFLSLEGDPHKVKVEGLGDEAVSFTTGDKKHMSLVLRRGNLVLVIHAYGGKFEDGQAGKILDLAKKLLVAIPLVPVH